MAEQRVVGGMRCGEVLEVLSDLVDGELNERDAAAVAEHLRGCDWCERFGGSFSGMVSDLRRSLADAEALEPEVEKKFLSRLEREMVDRSDE